MIVKQYMDVKKFMEVAGQKTNNTPTHVSYNVANFRLTLIREELFGSNELVESMQRDNRVGVLDGICDVLYVVYGAMATYGITPDDYTHVPTPYASSIPTAGRTNYLIRSLKNVFDKYERDIFNDDLYEIRKSAESLISIVIGIADEFNLDVEGAFEEVHSSNMSKFCFTEYDAEHAIQVRLDEGKTDYLAAVVVKLTDEYFGIKRAVDGKILKPLSFFEPSLEKFLK